ncbi:MAG TPA: hypothetical protein VMI52_11195 [Acetobacteraceae bacterium]|nr:hypothetical protein [Acetobacteraceae bacterium]
MNRRTIGLIWALGLALAALIYAAGPGGVMRHVLLAAERLGDVALDLMATISNSAFDMLRALAIALYVVFVCLGVMAVHQGLRGRTALVTVTLLFLLLVLPEAEAGSSGSTLRWWAAFLLAAFAAFGMTRRLLGATK